MWAKVETLVHSCTEEFQRLGGFYHLVIDNNRRLGCTLAAPTDEELSLASIECQPVSFRLTGEPIGLVGECVECVCNRCPLCMRVAVISIAPVLSQISLAIPMLQSVW
jgi:hypothetical protein